MKTVLILDDETSVRESLGDYFADRGWRVLHAGSAEEALALLSIETPDGAVVDIRLPGMDGNGFILEASAKNSDMVFIVATGSPEYLPPEEVVRMPRVSTTVFIKPISSLAEVEREMLRQIEKLRTL